MFLAFLFQTVDVIRKLEIPGDWLDQEPTVFLKSEVATVNAFLTSHGKAHLVSQLFGKGGESNLTKYYAERVKLREMAFRVISVHTCVRSANAECDSLPHRTDERCLSGQNKPPARRGKTALRPEKCL